jgi:hypothetical protein
LALHPYAHRTYRAPGYSSVRDYLARFRGNAPMAAPRAPTAQWMTAASGESALRSFVTDLPSCPRSPLG